METSVLTKKSQIVIPLKIRRKMGIKPGTRVGFLINGKRVYLQPLDKEYFRSLIGVTGTKGKAIKSLYEDKRKEREL